MNDMNTPEPPPLSIVVDDHDHAWQAFVATDGSDVNLWYPAAPRWGGHSTPAKTWDELLALGKVRVVTHGRTEVAERADELLALMRGREQAALDRIGELEAQANA